MTDNKLRAARPRNPATEAGKRLARQPLSKAVTIDQILDIEDEAAALAASATDEGPHSKSMMRRQNVMAGRPVDEGVEEAFARPAVPALDEESVFTAGFDAGRKSAVTTAAEAFARYAALSEKRP